MTRVALLCATLLTLAGPLGAQGVSILVGGVRARYADSISGTAGFAAARVSGSSSRAAGTVEAGFSRFTSGEWVMQIAGHGSGVVPLGRNVAVGMVGGGFANTFEGATWSGAGTAGPMLAFAAAPWLASLGVSAGRVRRVDESSLTVGTADGRIRFTANSAVSLEAGITGTTTDTLQYLDATLTVTARRPRIRLAVSAGTRAGDLSDGPWGQARLELALTPRTTLEGALGRYPRDLTGFTDGLFANIGLRVSLTAASRPAWTSPPQPPLQIERKNEGLVRITITIETEANTLEIVGDWNGWIPLSLTRDASNRWSIDLRLAPGVYKYALVVDGETWTIPEDVASVPDDLGGRVGILVVR